MLDEKWLLDDGGADGDFAGGTSISPLRLARYFSANAKTHRKHRSREAVFSVRLICMGIG